MKVAIYILTCLALVACNQPKMIPETELREILREAFISQSAAHHIIGGKVLVDTVDMHSPILSRYGYNLEDLRYTIRNMSMRKSNPLPNVLETVAADIRAVSDIAQGRYRIKLQIDTLAQRLTADTIYRKDTLISGRIDGYKWTVTPREGQEALEKGRYNVLFNYSTGGRASSYSKSLEYSMVVDSSRKYDGTLWLTSSKDTLSFDRGVDIDRSDVKSLKFSFKERPVSKGVAPDTIYLKDIRIVRILPADLAREIYYVAKSGFMPFDDRLDQLLYRTLSEAVTKLDSRKMTLAPHISDSTKRYFATPRQWPELSDNNTSKPMPPRK